MILTLVAVVLAGKAHWSAIVTKIESQPPPRWVGVANCESGGDWHINTGNGFYGGVQFTQESWIGAGGLQFAPRADLATPMEQGITADRLKDSQGLGAWPRCGRYYVNV